MIIQHSYASFGKEGGIRAPVIRQNSVGLFWVRGENDFDGGRESVAFTRV